MFKFLRNSDKKQRRAASNIFKFLAVMLVFTIVARGTHSVTLARVQISTPARSEIINDISGAAKVSSRDTIEITAPAGLIITEIFTGAGQQIEIGEPVAAFSIEELTEQYIRETAGLNRLVLDLERLERGENTDGSTVENARRTLERRREDYNNTVRQGEQDIAAARDALDALLAEASINDENLPPSVVRNLERALEEYENTHEQTMINIAEAESALRELLNNPPNETEDTALQNAITNHQRVLEDFNSVKEQGEADIAAAQEALDEARANRPTIADRAPLDNAQRNHDRAREDYERARRAGEENIEAARLAYENAVMNFHSALMEYPPNEGAINAAHNAMVAAQNAIDTAERQMNDNLFTRSRALEDAATALAQAQHNFNTAQQGTIEHAEAALETATTRAADNLQRETRRLQDAETSLALAQHNFSGNRESEIERAETALETARTNAENQIRSAKRAVDDATFNVSTEITRAQNNLQTAIANASTQRQNAARQAEDAQVSLTAAERAYEQNSRQSADTAAQNLINMSTMQLDISSQQKVVNKLEEILANDGILYAENAGSVISALPAGSTVGNAPVVTLRDTSGGFKAVMQITASEAEQLSVGSEVSVTTGGGSIFFTPTVTAAVESISPPDENDRVEITIALPPGDWNAGRRADAQILISRASYDFTVPVSALRTDNAGNFLYVVTQRSTVLGLQNVVTRVNVTIIAADNTTVSVSGPVHRNSQVISASSKAITEGDRVRVN
jgi:multidrug efflux pump subunit AcrA (membrane-fusion protein)